MAKKPPRNPRPAKGRPPGRRDRGGIGPGPAYKPGGTGKGTSHKSSSVEGTPIIRIVYVIAFGVVGTMAFVGYGLLHGYGVI